MKKKILTEEAQCALLKKKERNALKFTLAMTLSAAILTISGLGVGIAQMQTKENLREEIKNSQEGKQAIVETYQGYLDQYKNDEISFEEMQSYIQYIDIFKLQDKVSSPSIEEKNKKVENLNIAGATLTIGAMTGAVAGMGGFFVAKRREKKMKKLSRERYYSFYKNCSSKRLNEIIEQGTIEVEEQDMEY